MREKNLPKVSWDGMPLGRSKNVSSHPFLTSPNVSISTQESAPETAAQMAIAIMLMRECFLVLSILGSSSLEKMVSRGEV